MPIVQISGFLLSLLGCAELPTDRQSLEVISIDQTGRLVVVRMTQGDTGWLKGTGHFKATIWTPDQHALEFWDHAPKSHIIWDEDQISIGPRHTLRMSLDSDTWQLDSHFDEWNLRMMGTCKVSNIGWQQSSKWNTQVICPSMDNTGWIQSHDQSQLLKGSSITLFHEGSDVVNKSHWFISTTPTLQLMVEQTPFGLYGYMKTLNDDGVWESIPVQTINKSNEQWQINTESGSINIDNIESIGIEDPYQHIASWERWMTQPLYQLNHIQWQKGHGEWQEQHFVVVMREQGSGSE